MATVASKINPALTLEYLTQPSENKYYDRKSAQIKPVDLAPLICAFANGEGGTVAIGISDKSRRIEGINFVGDAKINDFLSAPMDFCHPTPENTAEFLDVTNESGNPDRILLLHIKQTKNDIIRTSNESVYLRVGDKTKEMKGDDLRNLEYSMGARQFEDEISFDADLKDLDEELLNEYKKRIGAENMSTEKVLRARKLLILRDGKQYLTNAAVLLFSNDSYYFPQNVIRFIRYDGTEKKYGDEFNLIKDREWHGPLITAVRSAQDFVATQVKEYTRLMHGNHNATFHTTPEYPEFTWKEGIANAAAHRIWGLRGDYIRVSMFDDRIEIFSPGKFPNVISIDNIKDTRFARNPKICEILNDFEIVRRLNEGVGRIYREMDEAGLPAPEFKETDCGVTLILRNGIGEKYQNEFQNLPQKDISYSKGIRSKFGEIRKKFGRNSEEIVALMSSNPSISIKDISKQLSMSSRTIEKRVRELRENGVIRHLGPTKGGYWEILVDDGDK